LLETSRLAGSVPPLRHTSISAVGEIRAGFGDPHRWDDPHELTLDQQIRLQMEDPDPAKKRQPRLPTHRIITRDQTFTPSILTCTSGASGSAGGATSESQAPFG